MTFPRHLALKCFSESITPAARILPPRNLRRANSPAVPWLKPVQHFATTRTGYKKVDFSQKQDPLAEASKEEPSADAHKAGRKGARKNAGQTSSLRRVAVEAQRSRGFVKGRGSKRFVDPHVDTKV